MDEQPIQNTDPMAELNAMTEVAKALQPLDSEAIRRVIAWAADRFGASESINSIASTTVHSDAGSPVRNSTLEVNEASYEDIADLYGNTLPRNDPEKALVVAYWFQKINGASDFDSASINRELKHLGHGISNITSALSSLMSKKPQLVIQTRKSGSSQQARKQYKLTNEGLKYVDRMLRGEES